MNTSTIRMIERCNQTDAAKVQAIAQAYTDGAEVKPAVLIDYGNAVFALSGSHRLDALQAIHGGEITLDELEELGLVIVEDANELYENGTEEGRAFLEELRAGRGGDMADGIRALWDGLYPACREALEDQLV